MKTINSTGFSQDSPTGPPNIPLTPVLEVEPSVPLGLNASTSANLDAPLPRKGLMERDWQKVLVALLTVLAGVALLWVLWQMIRPIQHTLILFGLAAVLAFALSGPVNMLALRVDSRLAAIIATYLLVGGGLVGGLVLLAGPFVRDATALIGALPQYAADLQARAPEVQNTLGGYGVQAALEELQPWLEAALETGGAATPQNPVGTPPE